MGTSLLTDVPYEVIYCDILQRLRARDLVSLSRASREANRIVCDSGLFDRTKHVRVGDLTVHVKYAGSMDMLRGVRVMYGHLIVYGDVGDALARLEVVIGSFFVNNVTTTRTFASLTTVGSLLFSNCEALVNVNGLESLTTVDHHLKFNGCTALADLTGLAALTTVGRHLIFSHCMALVSTAGFESLTTVGGKLSFYHCPNIVHMNGLASLPAVEGKLTKT